LINDTVFPSYPEPDVVITHLSTLPAEYSFLLPPSPESSHLPADIKQQPDSRGNKIKQICTIQEELEIFLERARLAQEWLLVIKSCRKHFAAWVPDISPLSTLGKSALLAELYLFSYFVRKEIKWVSHCFNTPYPGEVYLMLCSKMVTAKENTATPFPENQAELLSTLSSNDWYCMQLGTESPTPL